MFLVIKCAFDLSKGFPLVTTKKCHLLLIIHELLWFIKGESNIAYLNDNGVKIWDAWATEEGELGPVYGVQWRNWPAANGETIDQLAQLIQDLKRILTLEDILLRHGTLLCYLILPFLLLKMQH